MSFLLRPADGETGTAARPGQYVSVRLGMPDGVHQLRRYSLSSDPDEEIRRITVKRATGAAGESDGEVSTLLHENLVEGAELSLSAPFGDVFLDEPADGTTPGRAGLGRSCSRTPAAPPSTTPCGPKRGHS
ncbi:hypothetical protein [Streptomyces sp. NBC_00151]|uniref:hypothetical protein n=1 Tax=Streptomyces sp. NBC_00151 TaxID=2975669 RepID=UPI002DD8A669|nr:hypothetical protein [Streptomyces sp. NBC_00151]WRZ44222.1 hypothetical protein OG915_43000 [Streptomyces sp. NBC_00151]